MVEDTAVIATLVRTAANEELVRLTKAVLDARNQNALCVDKNTYADTMLRAEQELRSFASIMEKGITTCEVMINNGTRDV